MTKTKIQTLDPQHPRLHSKTFTKPSKTRRSEVVNTHLPTLVNNVRRAGVPGPQAVYADLSNIPKDLIGLYHQRQRVHDAFTELPAIVQAECGHNPHNLEAWIRAQPARAQSLGVLLPTINPPSPPSPPGPPAGGPAPVETAPAAVSP